MGVLHIRDVSDDTITTLKQRAGRAGQSLQAYLRQLLDREAETLTMEEAADQARAIASRSTVTTDDVLEAIEASRRSRG